MIVMIKATKKIVYAIQNTVLDAITEIGRAHV